MALDLILPPDMQKESLTHILSQVEDEVKIWADRFFNGQMPVRCSGANSCGSEVRYCNGVLRCPQCGKTFDRVHLATSNPQEGVFIKPVVEVATRKISIAVADSDFFPIDPIKQDDESEQN